MAIDFSASDMFNQNGIKAVEYEQVCEGRNAAEYE